MKIDLSNNKWLTVLFKQSGLSQNELARRVNAQDSVVNRWLTGKQLPGSESIQKIVSALGYELHIKENKMLTTEQALAILSDRKYTENIEWSQDNDGNSSVRGWLDRPENTPECTGLTIDCATGRVRTLDYEGVPDDWNKG